MCVCVFCVEIELSYVHIFNIVVIGLEQAARRSTCIQKCDMHSNICMHNIFIYFISLLYMDYFILKYFENSVYNSLTIYWYNFFFQFLFFFVLLPIGFVGILYILYDLI